MSFLKSRIFGPKRDGNVIFPLPKINRKDKGLTAPKEGAITATDFVQNIKELRSGLKKLAALLGIRARQGEVKARTLERLVSKLKQGEDHE